MVVQIDTREKDKATELIRKHFERQGIQYFRSKLFVGDYCSIDNPKLVVDRKQNLSEVAQNFSNDEKRFVAEMKRAQQYGFKIVFLVEHSTSINKIEDVQRWVNPRHKESPMAPNGDRLYRKMLAYQNTYGVEFQFCSKMQTGKRIVEILNGERT